MKSKEIFENKVIACCKKTFYKAKEYRNETLLQDAQSKMKNVPLKAKEFKFDTDLQYYGETGNIAAFTKAAKGYASKIAKKDAQKLSTLANQCMQYFKGNKSISQLAEQFA